MACYNLVMSAFSLWAFVTMIYCLNHLDGANSGGISALRGNHWKFADEATGGVYTFVVYAFYVSKYVEFLDTYFLLLCDRPVSWLQWCHHLGAPLTMGVLYWHKFDSVWIFVTFNGFIHTIMYFYYACCILKWPFPRAWRPLLTSLQLIQFFAGVCLMTLQCFVFNEGFLDDAAGELNHATVLSSASRHWLFSLPDSVANYSDGSGHGSGRTGVVPGARRFCYVFLVQYVAMLVVLFGNFYYQNYIKSVVSKAKKA
jgi:hypothetical protein